MGGADRMLCWMLWCDGVWCMDDGGGDGGVMVVVMVCCVLCDAVSKFDVFINNEKSVYAKHVLLGWRIRKIPATQVCPYPHHCLSVLIIIV